MSSALYMSNSDTIVSQYHLPRSTFTLIISGDLYVNFDCSKLEGYEVAKDKMENEAIFKGLTIEKVCALDYLGWSPFLDWHAPIHYSLSLDDHRPQHAGESYDFESIMQYSSYAWAAASKSTVRDLPLVRWKNGRPKDGSDPDELNAAIIPGLNLISDGDKEAVQKLYPLED